MRRRDLLLLLLCVAGRGAWAQSAGRNPRLGILSAGWPPGANTASSRRVETFLRALRDRGYVDGRNIELEFRFAEGRIDQLPRLAAELVSTRPDLIYTWTSPAAIAAAKATSDIPIVGTAGEETLAELAGNFARPTGNVTGFVLGNVERAEKCLELLHEMAPRASRVGVLVNPANPIWRHYPDVLSSAADRMGMTLTRMEARGLHEVEQALSGPEAKRLDALLLVDDAVLVGDDTVRERIIEFARRHRLPTVSPSEDYARDGGLMSFGTDQTFLRERAAYYVHRILQGARPSELPVERPLKLRLVINLGTAKSLRLDLPPAILARADEVIE